MAVGRYEEGSLVYLMTRISDQHEKKRPARVIKLGNSGIQVRLEGGGEDLWVGRHRLIPRETEVTEEIPMTMKEKRPLQASIASLVEAGSARFELSDVSGSVPAPAPPAAPIPDVSADRLKSMEDRGMDPFKVWLSMGEALIERQEAHHKLAMEQLESKKVNYRAAQAILADAESEVQQAQDATDATKAALAAVKKRVRGE